MSMYKAFKKRRQKRMDAFLSENAFFAFSDEQFEEGLRKLGLQAKEIVSIGAGRFLRRDKEEDFRKLLDGTTEERKKALQDPEDGDQFAYEMFFYELADHEFNYTQNAEDTLDALGFTNEEIDANPRLWNAFERAKSRLSGKEA